MRRAFGLIVATLLLVAVTAPAVQAESKAEGAPHIMGFASSIDYPAGTFEEGQTYTYWTRIIDPSCACDDLLGPITFSVDSDAPIYAGRVHLRFWGLLALEELVEPYVLNPDQPTRFVVVNYWGDGVPSVPEAKEIRDGVQVLVSFTGPDGPWTQAPNGPIQNLYGANGVYTWINDKWHQAGIIHRT